MLGPLRGRWDAENNVEHIWEHGKWLKVQKKFVAQ